MNNRLHFLALYNHWQQILFLQVAGWVPEQSWGLGRRHYLLSSVPVPKCYPALYSYSVQISPHEDLTMQSLDNINKKTSLEKILKEVKFSLETEFNFSARGYIVTPPPRSNRAPSAKIVSVKVSSRDFLS
jgi:hypothetical protein